jgi:RecB family endonuclease NucS
VHVDRADRGVAVGAHVAEQDVRRLREPLCDAVHVDARPGAVPRGLLRRRRGGGRRLAVDLGLALAAEVRPDREAVDVNPDRDAHHVVLAQPAVPEEALARGPQSRLGQPPHHRAVLVGRLLDRLGAALDEHELGTVGRAVLPGVVGERDPRLGLDPLELLGKAERGREPDGAVLAVAQADRSDRHDDGTPGRSDVAERGRQVRVEDLVDVVGPADGHARTLSDRGSTVAVVRLIVARCEVRYTGRLTAVLPEALRLLMLKSDGSVMVHADTGGFKPQNWMTPPTVIEEEPGLMVVRKRAGSTEDRLEIRIAEVLSDVTHDMGEAAALEKEGVERELQELLADAPPEGMRLVKREWPTDIGPVDLMCRDDDDGFVAVEIKRVGTIEAVEQLTRYLELISREPGLASCRGVLAAQVIKPQARTLAEARGIDCVEVDPAVLRGEREPDLTLFA